MRWSGNGTFPPHSVPTRLGSALRSLLRFRHFSNRYSEPLGDMTAPAARRDNQGGDGEAPTGNFCPRPSKGRETELLSILLRPALLNKPDKKMCFGNATQFVFRTYQPRYMRA